LRGASQGKNTERTKWGAPWGVCPDGGRKGSIVVILRCWWLDVARCGNSSRAHPV